MVGGGEVIEIIEGYTKEVGGVNRRVCTYILQAMTAIRRLLKEAFG